jgi:hypothetical protein
VQNYKDDELLHGLTADDPVSLAGKMPAEATHSVKGDLPIYVSLAQRWRLFWS